MAFATATRTTGMGILDRISEMTREVSARRAQYRVYSQTVNELSALSNRDLADLGLSRSQINSVAHEAAYGK